MRLFAIAFVLLLGVDSPEPAQEPVAEPLAAPAEQNEASGDELLALATRWLADGKYDEALSIAVPAISTYPELAPSFRAIVEVAADQQRRRRGVEASAGERPVRPSDRYYDPRSGRYRRQRPPDNFSWGFEVGAPTGARMQWELDEKFIEAVGLRIGGNLAIYHGVTMVTDTTLFATFPIVEQWNIEVGAGALAYYGWLYPQIGVAGQFDPKGPMQVNLGARIGTAGVILPDASVGFVW